MLYQSFNFEKNDYKFHNLIDQNETFIVNFYLLFLLVRNFFHAASNNFTKTQCLCYVKIYNKNFLCSK